AGDGGAGENGLNSGAMLPGGGTVGNPGTGGNGGNGGNAGKAGATPGAGGTGGLLLGENGLNGLP
ncbi:hypothetical protein, partial [Mycobacterium tuberculosis]|uniref:hypothetical protein n=1 Tax=Mycobacterium tuberculosis TaxID=1773 RepID=UPI000A5FC20D